MKHYQFRPMSLTSFVRTSIITSLATALESEVTGKRSEQKSRFLPRVIAENCLSLGPPVIEAQAHHLAFPHREMLHLLVEPGPPLQFVVRLGYRGIEARSAVVGSRRHAVVVRALPFRAVVVQG